MAEILKAAGWRLVGLMLAVSALAAGPLLADELPRIHLRVVGALGGVSLYTDYEEPFWTRTLTQRSAGRITAEIVPFTALGLNGSEMIRLVSNGVFGFGSVAQSVVDEEDPVLLGLDLSGLNPDGATLRHAVERYRAVLETYYHAAHGLKLLGLSTYPAQVLYCRDRFASFDELVGRRIRVAGHFQTIFVNALGAVPVPLPFARVRQGLERGEVDCTITGTLTGNTIGLYKITKYLSPLTINWGVVAHVANEVMWRALDPEAQSLILEGTREWTSAALDAADAVTQQGIYCNVGDPRCHGGVRADMVLVPPSPSDEVLRRAILVNVLLPAWGERCGRACARRWNESLGNSLGLTAPLEPSW